MSRVGLGAAQFGLDYGITNRKGKVLKTDLKLILDNAISSGVQLIDTASHYGNSENIIGGLLPKNNTLKIVTKIPNSCLEIIDQAYCEQVRLAVQTSLQRLRINQLYGLLIHQVLDLKKPGADLLLKLLYSIRKDGFVKKIGVSIYSEEDVELVLENFIPDLIQVPLNILDQRLIDSGKLKQMSVLGIEIHARSLFLQGLILANSNKLPEFFWPIKDSFKSIENMANNFNLSKLELCLLFGFSIKEVDNFIIGITSLKELKALELSLSSVKENKLINFKHLSIQNEKYLNPTFWNISSK
jgi:aryl-alcohol dehydrogenase-like predicted oxidoreductase